MGMREAGFAFSGARLDGKRISYYRVVTPSLSPETNPGHARPDQYLEKGCWEKTGLVWCRTNPAQTRPNQYFEKGCGTCMDMKEAGLEFSAAHLDG